MTSWARAGRKPKIAVIGAGMSGIAAVIKLRAAGYDEVAVYEKADRVGGTWRENTYPGLSCDVPSHWYSYTFAPNPDWSHRYSYGAEIQAYFEGVAKRFDVLRDVRFRSAVTRLDWEAPEWRLETARGEVSRYDVVVSATGVLHHPSVPDIPGLGDFTGPAFHSAEWDHSVALEGKRVGVVGTGSTASQIVGAIAEDVERLVVFQRTPQWMVPLPQKAYSVVWRRFLRLFPPMQRLLYWYYYTLLEWTFAEATIGNRFMQRVVSRLARQNLEQNVPDPELRARLTPDYQAACKRLILCSSFYPAISRPNVELVTERIDRVEPTGIRTKDGELHELDILVLATGFRASDFILPTKVVGEDGIALDEVWDGAPRAHRAMSIPGFPNFWMLEGPTGPVGNVSLVSVTENQIDYLIQCLDKMRDDGLEAMAPKREACERYNAEMSEAVKSTVWVTGGCQSWYIDASGVPNLYPWAPRRFRREMRRPDFSEYRLMRNAAAERDRLAA